MGGGDEHKKQFPIQLAPSALPSMRCLVCILFLFFLPTSGLGYMQINTSWEIFLESRYGWWKPWCQARLYFTAWPTEAQSCLFAFRHPSFVFCPSKGSTSSNSRYSSWVNQMTLEYSREKLANSVAIFLKCGQPLTSSAKPHQAQMGPILLKIYLRLFFLLSVPQAG